MVSGDLPVPNGKRFKFNIDKLKSTGFKLEGNVFEEIDNTIAYREMNLASVG